MDLQLLCCEKTTNNEIKAYADKVLLTQRVLQNLLQNEVVPPRPENIFSVQHEVTSHMRKIVSEWMMEVCDEQNCQDEVFLMAINYMDRFLTRRSIGKAQLQLLGTTCMLIASKLRESQPLPAKTLACYTDNSITVDDIMRCELLVVSALKWDLSVVTAQDFVTQILRRLSIDRVGIEYSMVNTHTKTLIALCARELEFSHFLPSVIAAASIASALCGLGWSSKTGESSSELLHFLKKILMTDKNHIFQCFDQIEQLIRLSSWTAESNNNINSDENLSDLEAYSPFPVMSDEFTSLHPDSGTKHHEKRNAATPTDVRDVHF